MYYVSASADIEGRRPNWPEILVLNFSRIPLALLTRRTAERVMTIPLQTVPSHHQSLLFVVVFFKKTIAGLRIELSSLLAYETSRPDR